MKPLIYLASPYWHEQEVIRLARSNMVKRKTAELLEMGVLVYSPICHNVEVAKHLPTILRHSHDFWMAVDLPMLSRCNELWVLQLAEWQLSRGIAAEIEHAKSLSLPIRYIDYADSAFERNTDLPQQAAEELRSGSAPAARGLD